ncbi:MAG: hypothetical protein WC802_01800 [Patescibacteria group bacterium]|jgi:hypothetical protein
MQEFLKKMVPDYLLGEIAVTGTFVVALTVTNSLVSHEVSVVIGFVAGGACVLVLGHMHADET